MNVIQSIAVYVLMCSIWTISYGFEPYWDGLKVRFGRFIRHPRTEADALKDGFVKISECDEISAFRGKRYMKNNESNVILLYDVEGHIAGVQAGIPKDLPGYPTPEIKPQFMDHDDMYLLTAYLVDPVTICRRGRSSQIFDVHGTGNVLYIQNGTNPETDLMEVPLKEPATPWPWVKGRCFPKMGFHYFYHLEQNMRCEEFLPVALLYYEGELKGFVWSFGAVMNTTTVPYEHPEPDFFNELMFQVPTCLKTLRRSTLHVYLEDNPESYSCIFNQPSAARYNSPAIFTLIATFILLKLFC